MNTKHVRRRPCFVNIVSDNPKVIPYTKIFKPKSCPGNATPTDAPEPVASHQFLHANVMLLQKNRVYFKRLSGSVHDDQMSLYVDFDYLVYALGSHLPAPINIWSPSRSSALTVRWLLYYLSAVMWLAIIQTPYISQESLFCDEDHAGTKLEAIKWLRDAQRRIQTSRSVLVIGGGALGVRKYPRRLESRSF
jgi:apoptosis-inducing factor 2